jgi:hypothetical protein
MTGPPGASFNPQRPIYSGEVQAMFVTVPNSPTPGVRANHIDGLALGFDVTTLQMSQETINYLRDNP